MNCRFWTVLGLFWTVLCSTSAVSSSGQAGSGVAPNELGKVPILEYHLIEPQETRWGRSVEHFRQDMELLYRSGYRPIGMAEYISGKVPLAAGMKPVLFTFDDSSPGQFRYLVRDGKRITDPDCAVGMLVDFHKRHPDWSLKGVFFVLTGAKEPHKLFGQPEYEADKLRELVALGFEIGNHTLWHADLAKYDAQTIRKQLAMPVKQIGTMVPGYVLRALALPFGSFPKDRSLAVRGSFEGTTYHNEAILMVAGGPAASPFSCARDLERLPRVQMVSGTLESVIRHFDAHPDLVFVSDGKEDTVSFPRDLAPQFDAARYSSLHVVTR
jgi:peptidoglycan/xylan/chitin deacetylase (PgdA/CDA1 family)